MVTLAAVGVERASGPIDPALMPYITAIVVFGLAFLILYLKVWPKITKGLDDRDQKIRSEIEQAELAREQSKAALSEYQRELATAREEATRMVAQARNDAKAVADELRARNAEELTELKQRATREIEVARQQAITSIYAEASNLAVSIASKILQREITDQDQQNLVDESLEELAKVE